MCGCVHKHTRTYTLWQVTMHTGSPERIYPQAGKDACNFLGSRDAKTDEPFSCLVGEISPSHRIFHYLAAHSAVFMPIFNFLLLNFSDSNIYSSW